MNETLIKQIMEDYSCTREEILDKENHFTTFTVRDGRRKYPHIEETFLRAIVINGKLIFSGKPQIIEKAREAFSYAEGQWFCEPRRVRQLEALLHEFGYKSSMVHPYYISDRKKEAGAREEMLEKLREKSIEVVHLNQEELQKYADDERFDEAFGGHEEMPDVFACAAIKDGQIIGMSGASRDSIYMMQIGINVEPSFAGLGIGTALVSEIRDDIIDAGFLSYYGTSFSHIASSKVAIGAGFSESFIEWFSMPEGADED